ncbi:hypothetical protein V6N13_047749 [Hibiscus sabdariffa]
MTIASPQSIHNENHCQQPAVVAALCVQYGADSRPNMSIVVKALRPILNTSCPVTSCAHSERRLDKFGNCGVIIIGPKTMCKDVDATRRGRGGRTSFLAPSPAHGVRCQKLTLPVCQAVHPRIKSRQIYHRQQLSLGLDQMMSVQHMVP